MQKIAYSGAVAPSRRHPVAVSPRRSAASRSGNAEAEVCRLKAELAAVRAELEDLVSVTRRFVFPLI
jgi:hypothetical protein